MAGGLLWRAKVSAKKPKPTVRRTVGISLAAWDCAKRIPGPRFHRLVVPDVAALHPGYGSARCADVIFLRGTRAGSVGTRAPCMRWSPGGHCTETGTERRFHADIGND